MKEYLSLLSQTKKESKYDDNCKIHNNTYKFYDLIKDEHLCRKCEKTNPQYIFQIDSLPINTIRNQIIQVETFLRESMNNYKNKVIKNLKNSIIKFETAYHNCVEKNNNLIQFVKILVDNYQINYNSYSIINNLQFKIEKHKNIPCSFEIIEYFDTFDILNTSSFHQMKFYKGKQFNYNNYYSPTHLFKISDEVIALSNYVSKKATQIKLINFTNNQNATFSFDFKGAINNICILDNGYLIINAKQQTSVFTKVNYQFKELYSIKIQSINIIKLSNNRIGILTDNNSIDIFQIQEKSILIKIIYDVNPYQIVYFEERDLLISLDTNMSIINMKTYQIETQLSISINYICKIFKIDDDRVIITQNSKFLKVNITTGIIENEYENRDIFLGNLLRFSLLNRKR